MARTDPIWIPMITALSALDAVSTPVPMGTARAYKSMVTFGASTTAGAVVEEGSDTRGYTGVWELIDTITWSAATKKQAVAPKASNYAFVRHRVSVAIVGGTVTTAIRRDFTD